MIQVTIVGKLARDPEMRYTASGQAVCTLTVPDTEAISKEKRPECPDGWKESYNGKNWELTTWCKITVWGPRAETCNQWLRKGNVVAVQARLNGKAENGSNYPRIWEADDGTSKAQFEFTAFNVDFVTMGGDEE